MAKANKHINPYKMFRGIFIPNFIIESKELNYTSKFIYGILVRYAGKNGYCFPRQDTIAETLNISRQSVHKNVQNLIKQGFIDETRQGLGRPNIYRFLSIPCQQNELHDVNLETTTDVNLETTTVVKPSLHPINKRKLIHRRESVNIDETYTNNIHQESENIGDENKASDYSLSDKDKKLLFKTFWNEYPHKGGVKKNKPECRKDFFELSKQDQGSAIIAAKNYAASKDVREGFVYNPDNFLKGIFRLWVNTSSSLTADSLCKHDLNKKDCWYCKKEKIAL